jgi:DNA-directed RNA polymerase specialized sigma24 family protein
VRPVSASTSRAALGPHGGVQHLTDVPHRVVAVLLVQRPLERRHRVLQETQDHVLVDERERLARLPDAQAQVISLAYYGELTHSEIAVRLSLPPGTVKGRMRLGMQKLRAQFELAGGIGA